MLHVPAYALASCADPIAAAAEEVRRSGGRVTVDLSAATLIAQIGASEMRTLVGRLEPAVVFANEDEAGALGMFVTADIEDGWSPPWPVTVIKRGARAALVVRRVGRPVTEVPAELVPTVRDTTGAGDAFAGAFLAAWAGGASVESSCRAGHRGAAVVLGHAGAGG